MTPAARKNSERFAREAEAYGRAAAKVFESMNELPSGQFIEEVALLFGRLKGEQLRRLAMMADCLREENGP